MLDWSTIQFFLFLAAPYLIRRIQSMFNRQPTAQARPPPPPRPRTLSDRAVTVLLIVTAVYQLYCVLHQPINLFQLLDVNFEAPPYVLRDLLLGHAEILLFTTGLTAEELLDRLRTTHSRHVIATFGQDALLDCTFCRESGDYMLYVLPGIASTYALVVVVMGLATMTWRKQDLRNYATIFLVSMGVVELYSFMTYTPVMNDRIGFYQKADKYRRLAFVALVGALLVFERGNERTDIEVLSDIAREQETLINRSKAQSLQRASVMRDSNLRRLHAEYYKRLEIADGVVSADTEFQQARAQAMSRLDVERLMKDAGQLAGDLVDQGIKTFQRGFDDQGQPDAAL
ncbi:hypothetical protein BC938DRAFT_472229 [Jimgerdemannia flammicorona]|uniref:Uncharacterized protein n=1 Tax=Jimgerdemannia flammicorona TaxID=994334 RepID=A0A433Q6M3_9FUNG|nr:hypothetical protein BC938DRAFT_472229 [Jimgerdemannia flammicorona]